MAITQAFKSGLATIGYNLGLGGMGITQPAGTPYNANQTPYKVYNQTQGYTYSPNSGAQNAAASPNAGWYDYGTRNITGGGNGSTGGQVLGQQTNANNFQPPTQDIIRPDQNMGGGGSELDAINSEFNNFNSYLDQQEGTAQQNFTETKGLYDKSKANAEQQYNTEKVAQTEGYQKEGALNLGKVRQLLADLSQRDAARTAITGGGSVSEALGERFGRQAQSSLGNVTNQTQGAIERVNNFYSTALTKLQESYDSNVMQAKQTLDQNLSQIRGAKIQSASAKQKGTLSAWRDYYSRVNEAKVQAANFKAQYEMWKQQQDSALGATQGFNLANQDQYGQGVQPSYNFKAASVQTAQQNNPYMFAQGLTEEQKRQQQLYGAS